MAKVWKGSTFCSAFACTNNKKQHSNLSFFRFPKDKERCKRWVINCRRQDLDHNTPDYLYANCRLCSIHFEDSQFMNMNKNSLMWNAVPTIFPHVPYPPKKLQGRTLTMPRKLKDADHMMLCRTRTMILSLHKYFRSQDVVISETDLLLKTAAATGVSVRSIQKMKKLAKEGSVPEDSTVFPTVKDMWSTRKLPRRTRKVVLNIHKFFRSQDEVISETDLLLKTAAVTGVSIRTIQNIKKQFREEAKRGMKVAEGVESLSEPELEGEEDAELEEVVLQTVKEKLSVPDLDNPRGAEVKQDRDEGDSMEIKDEPITIKTEPQDEEHRDEKWPAETVSWAPEAKKSKIDFEKVWVKVEHDPDKTLDALEDEKSRSDFEKIWVKSELDEDKDSNALEHYKIDQQDPSQDCFGTERVFKEPELGVHATQPTPEPLSFQPAPLPLPVQTTSRVQWIQPTPQTLFVHPTLKVNTTQPIQQPLAAQPTLAIPSTQPTPQALSIQPTLEMLSTQPTLQPLSVQPTLNVLSPQTIPQPLTVQPTLNVLSSQPTPQPLTVQPTLNVLSTQLTQQPVLTQPAFFQVVNVLPIAPPLSLDNAIAPSHFPGYSNVIIEVNPQTVDITSSLPAKPSQVKSSKRNSKAPACHIFKVITMNGGSGDFETLLVRKEKEYEELRTNVTTDQQARKWLLEYSRENQVNFNVMTKFKGGKYLSLHWKCVCSRGDKDLKGTRKIYTGCEVTLVLQVQSKLNKSALEEGLRMHYPCKITITGEHNHVLEYVEADN